MKKFNKQALMDTAMLLDKLFIKYKDSSHDVAAAYVQCKPLIDRAMNGEINKSSGEHLPGGYFSTEFELIDFRDLYKAASLFDMYLEGWESEESFNSYMDSILE